MNYWISAVEPEHDLGTISGCKEVLQHTLELSKCTSYLIINKN